MLGNYQNMLDEASRSYTNILGGYQQAAQAQEQAQANLQAGYGQLYGNVLGAISGIGNAKSQEIADTYAAQSGAASQSLISRGLGNSTVASSVQRGLGYDQAKAQVGLAEQLGQLKAGYMSQIGQARLNQQAQDYGANTALRMQQLGYGGQYASQLLGYGAQGLGQFGPFGFGGRGGASAGGFQVQGGGYGGGDPFAVRSSLAGGGGYGYGGRLPETNAARYDPLVPWGNPAAAGGGPQTISVASQQGNVNPFSGGYLAGNGPGRAAGDDSNLAAGLAMGTGYTPEEMSGLAGGYGAF